MFSRYLEVSCLRVSTGVEGLDVMLKGGLIRGRTYLVKGGPGTGKTILSMHFLVEGAKRGEKSVYITLEESEDEIKANMEAVGMDLSGVEIVDLSPTSEHTIFSSLIDRELDVETFEALLKNIIGDKVDRIVVDSVTMLKVATNSEVTYRSSLLKLIKTFRELNATAILTSEIPSTIEDYLVSGVIELRMSDFKGKPVRSIKIVKMRGSSFDEYVRPYRITENGIVVYPDMSVFEL